MTQEFTATITCDECGSSQEFTLTGLNAGITELIMLAERSAWDCDGEDLCANCVLIRDDEDGEIP